MTFTQLEYLIEISRHGSINKAAQAIYVAQSSISLAIKELENELGITIFNRTARGVEFTSEGKELLGYAISMQNQRKWVEERFSRGASHAEVLLSVSTQHYPFSEDAFMRMLEDEDHAAYQFVMNETDAQQVIDDVSSRRSDLGVIYISSHTKKRIERMLNENNLVFTELSSATPAVYLRKGHPLSSRSVIFVEDLEGLPYVSFQIREGLASDFSEEYLPAESPSTLKRIYVTDRHTIMDIVSSSDAYTIGTGLLSSYYSPESVITRPLACEDQMHIGIIMRTDMVMSEKHESFISHLKDALNDSRRYTDTIRL